MAEHLGIEKAQGDTALKQAAVEAPKTLRASRRAKAVTQM